MRIATFAASVWLTLLGTMVLAQNVTHDHDRAAHFSSYKTYAWTRGTDLADELNHARIVRAIDAALVAKGLVRVEPGASPDVLVAYHASVDRDLDIIGPARWGSFGLGGPVLVGTLVVEISDPRTNAIVWRGMASSDLRPADKPDRRVAKATEKMFKNYPPKP